MGFRIAALSQTVIFSKNSWREGGISAPLGPLSLKRWNLNVAPGTFNPESGGTRRAMLAETPGVTPQSFSSWIGVPAILHTTVGDFAVPLRCVLIRESGPNLRVRIDEGWHVDIDKHQVIGIEKDRTSGAI